MANTYTALLRAINVGGHGKVAMSELRDLFIGLGFTDVQSVLQTGNLIFRTDRETGSELEHLLETQAAERLGLRTDFLVRTAKEWADVVAHNPFPDAAERDPGHLLVMFLKGAPDEGAVDALRAAVSGREELRTVGRHAYITYPDGIGRSRLTGGLVETRLDTRGTGRNWNTVLRVAALLQA